MSTGEKQDFAVIWRKNRKEGVAVYLYLKDGANKEGTCYPAIGTIARELHLSVSTVKRAINDLEENGFIRKKQRWRNNGGRSSLLFEIIREAQRGDCAGWVDYGMVHHDLCRELNTLRGQDRESNYC